MTFISGRLPSHTIGYRWMVGRNEVLDSSSAVGWSAQIRSQTNFRWWELFENSALFSVSVGGVLWLNHLGSIVNEQKQKMIMQQSLNYDGFQI